MAMLISRKEELPPFRIYRDSLGARSPSPHGELAYDGHNHNSEDDVSQLLIHVWAASEVSQALARAACVPADAGRLGRAQASSAEASAALRAALGGHVRREPMLVASRGCAGGCPLDFPSWLLRAAELHQLHDADDGRSPVAACPPGAGADGSSRVLVPAGLARSLVLFAASQQRQGL
jgi:hypothetical protein